MFVVVSRPCKTSSKESVRFMLPALIGPLIPCQMWGSSNRCCFTPLATLTRVVWGRRKRREGFTSVMKAFLAAASEKERERGSQSCELRNIVSPAAESVENSTSARRYATAGPEGSRQLAGRISTLGQLSSPSLHVALACLLQHSNTPSSHVFTPPPCTRGRRESRVTTHGVILLLLSISSPGHVTSSLANRRTQRRKQSAGPSFSPAGLSAA